jgi:2-amino-4-hydroxy-6-hydroxymethyldihydropteridine diphosphokinase
MPEALIGLGANEGDVRTTLSRALDVFCDGNEVRMLARSSAYLTPPWGVADQPCFINLCIAVDTRLAPRALLEHALAVERAFGRDRTVERRWGPRRLDIDILTYESPPIDEPGLTLPHPRLLERAFVLVPLMEIRPHLVVAGVPIKDALAKLDTTGIEPLKEP